jgi:hypothetical protein
VDKQIFLSIQYVVNIIEGSFDEVLQRHPAPQTNCVRAEYCLQVNKCAFLYDGQLVWSGFEQVSNQHQLAAT